MEKSNEIPVAEPQCGDVPGTWAYKTISVRFGRTVSRVLEENAYSHNIESRIKRLIEEIPDVPIRPIDDPGVGDLEDWNQYVEPYSGLDWHTPPWWFTEHYLYRRILEATGYFQDGDSGGVDPFSYQKKKGLEVSRESIRSLCGLAAGYLAEGLDQSAAIQRLLTFDLWGNQSDLSLWGADESEKPDHTDPQRAGAHILVDDTLQVARNIIGDQPQQRIDFQIDNAGFELVGDLVLSNYLLQTGLTEKVQLHVKSHPTYVSDATEIDILDTLAFLGSDDDCETGRLGKQLSEAFEKGKLEIRPHWFWTSPLAGWDMPDDLRVELAQAALIISKGDAHYRRILGDRHWPYEADFERIMAYYPAPIAALRTLKSELVVGLRTGQAEEVSHQDPEWLVNGRWGMVQFYPGRG